LFLLATKNWHGICNKAFDLTNISLTNQIGTIDMKVKSLIATSVLAASAVTSSVAMAESAFTANIGVTSNYMWRSLSQTNEQSAISGGLDYDFGNGFYVGTWASNVSWTDPIGYELDLYGGYGFDLGATSWDVGYIYYGYPLTSNDSTLGTTSADFGEAYVNFTWTWLGLGVAYQTNAATDDPSVEESGNIYYYVSGDWEVGGVGLGAKVGQYTFKNWSAGDYTYVEAYLSKDDFTFSVAKNNAEEAEWYTGVDDPRVWVSWSKSFDL